AALDGPADDRARRAHLRLPDLGPVLGAPGDAVGLQRDPQRRAPTVARVVRHQLRGQLLELLVHGARLDRGHPGDVLPERPSNKSYLDDQRRWIDAFPTPARLATASTLKPAQPRSPKSKIAASAILRSTSWSRGRPAAGASTCSTPHPSLLDEFRAAQPGRTRRRGRPGRGVARCPRTTAPADSATGVTNRNGGTGTAPSRAPLSGLHLAQGVAMRTKMTEMLGVEHPIVGFNRSPAVVA